MIEPLSLVQQCNHVGVDAMGIASRPVPCPYCQIERLTRERDEAIAHDRQPYPTAQAYEAVCAANDRKRAALERIAGGIRVEDSPWVSPADIARSALGTPDEARGFIPPLPIPEDRGQRYSGIKPSAEYQRGHADALKFCAAEIGRLREALERIEAYSPGTFRPLADEVAIWQIANQALRGADEAKAAPDSATCEHEWRPVIDVCKDRPCTGSVLGRRCQRCGLFDGTYSGPASKTEGETKPTPNPRAQELFTALSDFVSQWHNRGEMTSLHEWQERMKASAARAETALGVETDDA